MKPMLVQELAGLDGHAVAQHHVALHVGRRRSSTRCVRRVVSDRFSSSSWNGGVTEVQHFQLVAQHFDLAAGQVVVSVPAGRERTLPTTFEAELVAHARRS